MGILDVGTNIDASRGASAYSIASSQYHSAIAQVAIQPGSKAGYISDHVRTDADIRKAVEGWEIHGDWDLHSTQILIAEKSGVKVMLESSDYDGRTDVCVFSAKGMKDARDALSKIMEKLPEIPVNEIEDSVDVLFWTNTPMGPRSYLRELEAPAWKDVCGNYAAEVRDDMELLSDWTQPEAGGRLLLGHGPAGTGKTTAIRTLARSWKSWCSVHYIVDPDEFFGDASYMISVLLGGEQRLSTTEDGTIPWRLLIVEDCDELLTVDAKDRSGQQVARLLNVCDGMVGQGLRILLFLTTNEKVENFHEAIVRPGRCLKNLHFGALPAKEADAWRAANGLTRTDEDATLAELYGESRKQVELNTQTTKRLRTA